jgi:hypothetical protein
MNTLLNRIVIDPKVCGGKPCVRGTRIWVSLILDLLADGMTEAELLAEYLSSRMKTCSPQPGQGIAAVGLLGKSFGASGDDLEAASFNPNSDVDAPSASSAIFAVAIVRRPEAAFALISYAPT